MVSQSELRTQTSEPESESTPRKPYQKPEVRHERVFETMALSCGKIQVRQRQCASNRRNS
jgi:hypothetical protein